MEKKEDRIHPIQAKKKVEDKFFVFFFVLKIFNWQQKKLKEQKDCK